MGVVVNKNHKARHRVVTRWLELEEAATAKSKAPAVTLPDFTNPIEAARAWIVAMEKERQAAAKLLEVQPMVDGYSTFLARWG